MKKLIYILSSLLVINLVIMSFLFSSSNLKDKYFNYIFTNFYNNNHNDNNYNLIVKILQDTKKEEYIQYIDFINIKSFENLSSNKNIIAYYLEIPQKYSFVALYEKNDDSNKYITSLSDLLQINNIYFKNNFLIVEQVKNSSLNNQNKKELLEVFYFDSSKYISVFQKVIYSDIKSTSKYSKIIESSSIDFMDDDILKIICISTTSYYSADKSYPKKERFKEIYSWDNNLKIFNLEEKTKYKKTL